MYTNFSGGFCSNGFQMAGMKSIGANFKFDLHFDEFVATIFFTAKLLFSG